MSASIVVHVVPRARRSEVVGRHGDAIRIRLAAAPVDDAANLELVRFLAARLGVPVRAVAITRGARGRRKTVTIQGVAAHALEPALLGDPISARRSRLEHPKEVQQGGDQHDGTEAEGH